ncbi:FtsW/RodA/SpoVE family cell cycle protein [Odoribacter sp. OttesenSCG-928-L07]|nr:FtsW/RodA/SpoVE family cell cycle protein [Odoribacter sp. OttesenSCG-928-L07]MDL2239191.1 FtsW/RodA/SpoVE family cell cycle protein [Bacteroidales bacterium OttesenSCG-928-L14]MDL2240535.1 FtsW/RodA/SpoVE family cell cycle protein [Bacteroidales bacterium OttesenSCG-928-K22]
MVKLIKGDKGIYAALIILLLLSFIGVLTTYPTTVGVGKVMIEHAAFVVLGLIVVFTFEYINYKGKLFRNLMFVACILSLLSIILLYTPMGIGAAKAVRTLRLGGFSIQPVEFAKVFVLIYLCFVCNEKINEINSSWKYFILYILIPVGVLGAMCLERQGLSSTAIMVVAVFVLLLITPIKKQYIWTVVGVGILVLLLYIIFDGERNITWLKRILGVFNKEKIVGDPVNAIGRGGFFGTFFGEGKVKEFLINIDSDFVFSAFVEEGGIILGTFIILIYVVIMLRIAKIVLSTNDLFGKYLVYSLGVLIILQAAVHILVCIGIAPETGQQLPFVSKGGSSMLSMCLAMGIIQGVAIRNVNLNNKLS